MSKTMIVIIGIIAVSFQVSPRYGKPRIRVPDREASEETGWDRLAEAISIVESRKDDNAYNAASGALGRWQMKKIYVDEVNRILTLKKDGRRYHYQDRTNPKRAREMFDIYQAHHNPKKSVDRAIRLHRGLDSPAYAKEVKRNLKLLEDGYKANNGRSARGASVCL